jgi:DNA-binding NtrC family response regulator
VAYPHKPENAFRDHAYAAAPPEFVGRNPKILKLLQVAGDAAVTDAPILITGESGTGKEILARRIHSQSRRRERPYVSVNCGAIAGSLEESELFGYVAGAFTGAGQRKQGWFEAAHGGTIFLDEIGETSPQLQVKMLRVLQDGEYAPVGSAKNSHCDVRVVAATNQDLATAVKTGGFRADLYYRLDVIRIHVPPLRERKDDVPLLVRQFVIDYSRRYHVTPPAIAPGFIERLMRHHFPGNVRELSNYIHRAIISSNEGPLTPDLLQFVDDDTASPEASKETPATTPTPSEAERGAPASFHDAKQRLVELFEREYINAVLAECGGIIHRAAQRAGLSERSFHAKLRQYGIDGTSFRAGG